MCRLPDNLISSQARYGHFDTSPVPIYYTMLLIEFQTFFPFLKEVKEKIMQFFRNSLQILKDTMQ